jgi:hypothetical protein
MSNMQHQAQAVRAQQVLHMLAIPVKLLAGQHQAQSVRSQEDLQHHPTP